MGNKEEILNKLKLASQAYYNNEESILSDEEYDKLVLYAKDKGWLEQDKELNDGLKLILILKILLNIKYLCCL